VFADIDSTLITPGGVISAQSRRALISYTGAGGRVSLATGKHPLVFRELAEDLGLAGPHIAGNGAFIVEGGRFEPLSDISDAAPALERELQRLGVPYACYKQAGIYVDGHTVTAVHVQQLLSIQEPPPVIGLVAGPDPIFKILAFVGDIEMTRELQLRDLGSHAGVSCIRTSASFLEFVSPLSGKDKAIDTILNRHRWPSYHSAGIGDSENDLPMLRHCGVAVAVANASGSVLSAADRVVPRCEEDGVGSYLEEILARNLEVR
jgi:hypothetical protein